MNPPPGLEILHLSKTYNGRRVVQDVSLYVKPGEAVGLLGPNGAGKTTTFYMITGLIDPDKGAILLEGQDITGLPMHQRARLGISYLPQEASIFRGLTVAENISAALELTPLPSEIRKERLDELLVTFGLQNVRKSSALALSGGERRRVEIARALALNPQFILLDEPLAGIDPIAVLEIRSLIQTLTQQGIGVLITDHNVRETLSSVDRAYIMNAGTILTEGVPLDIIAHEEVRRVYLGESFSL